MPRLGEDAAMCLPCGAVEEIAGESAGPRSMKVKLDRSS